MSLLQDRVPLTEYVFFQEGPGLRKWQWTDDGMKVINVTNLLGDEAYTVDTTNTDKYISLVEFEEKYSHFEVDDGDFVVASSGNTYGKVGKITQRNLPLMMNTSVIRFRSNNSEKLDDQYLFCFLRSKDFRGQIDAFVTGGAQPNFGPSHLKKMDIPLPDIDLQRKIGAFIKGYDDLIENNRRRIQLLEESARLLYQEWFVHLRFPGHEQVKIIDGVPEGWTKEPLENLLVLQRGFDLPISNRIEGNVPIYASTGINGFHNVAKVKGPGVVTGRSGSLGTVMYVAKDYWPLNTTLWVKEFKKASPIFATYLLRAMKLEGYNGGAAVPTLNRNDVHKVGVLCPESKLMNVFEIQVENIFNQIEKLKEYNEKLTQARDLLLPKLMSGELTV